MILFIIIAIGFFIYSIFAENYLLDSINNLDEYNKDIEKKNRCGCTNYDSFLCRKYDERDYESIPKIILEWLSINVIFNCVNTFIVFVISALVVCIYPSTTTEYSFNINSLKDNLITSGEIHGGAFYVRGSIEGEINYYFSRTMNEGEKICHIPAKDTYIKYDNESRPHIEVHQITHKFPNWLQRILWVEACNSTITEYYVIVVPEGTMSTDGTYQIDME